MKFTTVATGLLFATSVIAAPGTAARRAAHAAKIARRNAGRIGGVINRVDLAEGVETNKSDVSYSSNWAGAVISTTGVTSVVGTFTVPTPTTTGSGSAWVGIDGDTCDTAILQTGIDWTKSGSSITYDAWYEWYPDYAYDFTGITIAAGNSITTKVTASSKTTGTAVITNNSNGESVTHSFTGGVDGDLCEYDAEWIVEDFEENNALVTFANFGTVTFTSASYTHSGTTSGVTGAGIIDIEQSSKILTNCALSGSSGVTCTYV